MIHAYILQITSCNSADVASQYSNELGEILRDSFDYSEEKAMKHLLDSGLLMFYFQVKFHSFKNPAQLVSVESVNQFYLLLLRSNFTFEISPVKYFDTLVNPILILPIIIFQH